MARTPGHPYGCLLTDRREDDRHGLHYRQRRRLCSDRRVDGRYFSPASRDARAIMRSTALYSTRNALTARTKRCGLIFVLYRVRRPGSLRLAQSTRLADALAFIARDGQPGASYLHNSGLIVAPLPLGRKAEMAGKEGGFRDQHGAMVPDCLQPENPLSVAKKGRLTDQVRDQIRLSDSVTFVVMQRHLVSRST